MSQVEVGEVFFVHDIFVALEVNEDRLVHVTIPIDTLDKAFEAVRPWMEFGSRFRLGRKNHDLIAVHSEYELIFCHFCFSFFVA